MVSVSVSALPPVGVATALSGAVTGLNGTAASVAVYLRAGGAWWGSKPGADTVWPVAPSGAFFVPAWASQGEAGDINAEAIAVVVLPAGAHGVPVLGASTLPEALLALALAPPAIFERSAMPAPGAPTSSPTPPPVQLAWPPEDVGARLAPAGGALSFAGYTWRVKDSGGAAVGPGPNVFSEANVFVDGAGLHLLFNQQSPTTGCGAGTWRSAEVVLDHALGYGTYLTSFVGAYDSLDPAVTFSPLFLWDDTGSPANGYREVDFEVARWGAAGDPTAAQFVLMPLAQALPPGWKVRYAAPARPPVSGLPAPANPLACAWSGGALDLGADAAAATTCVLRWFPGRLEWLCLEGLLSLDDLPSADTSRLLASYAYGHAASVPNTGGDSRVHINLWRDRGGPPARGRFVHQITASFCCTRRQGERRPRPCAHLASSRLPSSLIRIRALPRPSHLARRTSLSRPRTWQRRSCHSTSTSACPECRRRLLAAIEAAVAALAALATRHCHWV